MHSSSVPTNAATSTEMEKREREMSSLWLWLCKSITSSDQCVCAWNTTFIIFFPIRSHRRRLRFYSCQWHGKYVRHSRACKSMNIISNGSNSIGRRRQCHRRADWLCAHTQTASVCGAMPHRIVVVVVVIESSLFSLCKYSTIPVVILCSIHSINCVSGCVPGIRYVVMVTDEHFAYTHTQPVLSFYLQEMTLILRRPSQCMSMTNANMCWKNKENCDAWSHLIDDCHRRISIHIHIHTHRATKSLSFAFRR